MNTEQIPGAKALPAAEAAVHQAADSVRNCTEGFLAQSERYYREHPLPVLLGIFAVGVAAAAALIQRKEELTWRERFADSPGHATRDAFRGAFTPFAEKLHDGYDVARSKMRHAAKNIHDDAPLDHLYDSARRTINHLKFW